MTIKEKLTTIAKNQQAVFDAGRMSMLNPNQDIRATTSGAFVALRDVLPIEHSVNVTLSSETVTDFSNVHVKQFGKNLCPTITKEKTMNGVTFTPNEDGTIATSGTATSDFNFVITADLPYLPIGTTIALSGCPQGGSSTTYSLYLSWVGMHEYGSGVKYPIVTNIGATNWRKALCIAIKSGVNMDGLVFKPQIEIEHITEYEPFKGCTTYAVSADGAVTDMKSIAPNMTLVSEADGVTINCSYMQDVYEAGRAKRDYEWWDKITPSTRHSYVYAFFGPWWTDDVYNPVRELSIADCVNRPNSQFMYGGSAITDTKVPINLAWPGGYVNITSTFTNATKLKTIRKLTVNEHINMGAQFNECTALENLTIDGTIAQNFNAQWCPLTPESMISVILHLKNFTGTGSEYSTTLNFKDACWDALEEAALENPDEYAPPGGGTWKDYVYYTLCWSY